MRHTILIPLLLVCLTIPTYTQNQGTKPVDMTIKRFALFVGSNDGGPKRIKLRYAVSDAKAVRELMTELGGIMAEDAHLLVEPSRLTFMDHIEQLADKIEAARNQHARVEVILYYSGHSDENSLLLGKERIKYQYLRHQINRFNADVRIAILDSCASGAITRTKGGKKRSPFLLDAAYNMKGYAFMTSSSSTEASQESDRLKRSFFTHNLISGMRGAADTSQDGRITLNEAYNYAFHETLSQTEKTMSGPQHPNYNIQMSGTGDVILTDIRKSSVVLTLQKGLGGKFFIHDQQDRLVVELKKPKGRIIELGLAEGKYRIINIIDGLILESNIQLVSGEPVVLSADQFRQGGLVPTTARGDRAEPEHQEQPQYRVLPLNLSFLSSGHVHTINNFSLYILSSQCSILNGASVGAGISFIRERGNGIQISGIGNVVTGDFRFFQCAGVFNHIRGKSRGVAIAGIMNTCMTTAEGWQVAGILNYGGALKGFQIAGVGNISGADCRYLQMAGVFNIARGDASGGQIAGSFNYARTMTGAQVSPFNIAGEVTGVQLGVVNIGNRVEGTQIGVINIAKEAHHTPVGLLNIIANGNTALNLWVDSIGFFNLAVKHGSKRLYNLYIVGMDSRFDYGTLGLGMGTYFRLTNQLALSIEAIAKAINPISEPFSQAPALHSSLRFGLEIQMGGRLSLITGLSYNYFNNFDNGAVSFPDPWVHLEFDSNSMGEKHWIGIFLGFQLPLSRTQF